MFCGPLRECALASKAWHQFGNVDYFLVTWDTEDLSQFPIEYKHAIVSDYRKQVKTFKDRRFIVKSDINSACMFYNWSLVEGLPGINDYDRIVITRTDLFHWQSMDQLYSMFDNRKKPMEIYIGGYAGFDAKLIGDFLVITSPTGLPIISECLPEFLKEQPDDGFNYFKPHIFLDKYFKNHTRYDFFQIYDFGKLKLQTIIRPNTPKSLCDEEYGDDLGVKIFKFTAEWWRRSELSMWLESSPQIESKNKLKNLATKFKR